MSLLGGLNTLLNRAGNTVHNDVVSPVQRLVGNQTQSKPGFTPAPMQHVNLVGAGRPNFGAPQIPQYQGTQARLGAQSQLGLTAAFSQNLANAQPYVGQPLATGVLNNKNGAGAEYLGPQSLNQIVLGNNQFGQKPTTVLHEGLHRVYATNPQVQQKFSQAYNQSVTPVIKNYLTSRLYGYTGFAKGLDSGGVPVSNYDLSNINNLPPNLRNEAHSYLSELSANQPHLVPPALRNYYSQYFNSSSSPVAQKNQVASSLYRNFPQMFPQEGP